MEKIILKPGNKVCHPTLGNGIVTHADDEFCTVKFDSKEAMFRLPEAFEKGYLTSDDAVIVEETEDDRFEGEIGDLKEEVDDQDRDQAIKGLHTDNNLGNKQNKRIKITGAAIFVSILLGIIFIPIALTFFDTGNDFGEPLFYIICIVFFCSPLFGLLVGATHDSTLPKTHDINYGSKSSDSSFEIEWRHKLESSDEDIRKELYKRQDEDLAILEDMIQMHSVNKDADLESHYGWDHKIDYDQDGDNDDW